MTVRRVMGTEVEYGVSVPGQPGANPMVTSSQVVNAYGARPELARGGRAGGHRAWCGYRYWPVLLAVSMDRPASEPLPPEMSVRM